MVKLLSTAYADDVPQVKSESRETRPAILVSHSDPRSRRLDSDVSMHGGSTDWFLRVLICAELAKRLAKAGKSMDEAVAEIKAPWN